MQKYKYMRESIQDLSNINLVINSKIDDYLDYLKEDDAETIKDLKSVFIEFLLEMRTDNNLLFLAIARTKEVNYMPKELKELDVDSFKLELLKKRY